MAKKGKKNYVKSTFHLPRQQVAFWEKARKSEGLESLEGDFYTRFKPDF